MRAARVALAVLAVSGAPAARPESVAVCYNYGCRDKAQVELADEALAPLRALLEAARDANDERFMLSRVVGRLYALAGRQSPIWRDRGGNYEDDDADGRMDCLDHTANTSAFLSLLERRGWLRFHAVREPLWRGLFRSHRAARIEETASGAHYMVDSWFSDNGDPVPIFELSRWRRGARAYGR